LQDKLNIYANRYKNKFKDNNQALLLNQAGLDIY